MRNWVEIEQSIPWFLAGVTLECYDKWKREREFGGGEERGGADVREWRGGGLFVVELVFIPSHAISFLYGELML